jgi:hypothetical protein
MVALKPSACSVCLMGSPCEVDGIPLTRCARTSLKKNPLDCCRFFIPPSAGFLLPLGAPLIRGNIAPPRFPIVLGFDPRNGLIPEQTGGSF